MDVTTENAPQSSEGLKFVLGQSHGSLFPLLEEVCHDGGQTLLGVKEKSQSILFQGDYSGFRYLSDGWIQGHLLLSLLPSGGFCLWSAIANDGLVSEKWDIYSDKGELVATQYEAPATVTLPEKLEIELECPMLDLFYNYLASQYSKASSGNISSLSTFSVERFVRRIRIQRKKLRKNHSDPLIKHVYHKMLLIESDPVLNWEERQTVYANLLDGLKRVLTIKYRAQGKGTTGLFGKMWRFRLSSFLRRFKMRPWDNAKGLLYQMTVAKVIWFFRTVKDNLGYSVALAVYGPFTYYFITMPMNPHAMQAVGRVRSAYLEVKSSITDSMDAISGMASQMNTATAVATTPALPLTGEVQQTLNTSASHPINKVALNANVIGVSQVTQTPGEGYGVLVDGKIKTFKPSLLQMLLTTDVSAANMITWSERMGNFKQMQIAYEESLQFAPRMGRLEQLETQYNFPMVVENAWEEMERYNQKVFRLRQGESNLSPKLKQYLTNEVNRSQQLELYLWDRLARFILDQPYVMLDEDREQTPNDYYIGRSFVFMEEMTQILGWRYPDMKKPYGYDKIAAAAQKYREGRAEKGNILANLKANSDLFKQKDPFSSTEFRAKIKRQWEVLYLQNAKAEEASNNGLNMYIWSVRNTVWCLQSLYSAKRQELELLVQRDLHGTLDAMNNTELSKLEMLQETLFHNLTMEWVGIKHELGNYLARDIETVQRKIVIDNLRESLVDRSKLFNQIDATASNINP